jgi:hypothetical protein
MMLGSRRYLTASISKLSSIRLSNSTIPEYALRVYPSPIEIRTSRQAAQSIPRFRSVIRERP